MSDFRDKQLWKIAKKLIDRDKPLVIAVGGGIAKTSTKVAIGRVLEAGFPGEVQVGYGNLNTLIGVPLSIIGIEADFHKQYFGFFGWLKLLKRAKAVAQTKNLPKYLVLEYGTDQSGDIVKLTKHLKPNMAVITLITPAHVENYRDVEDMADDEAALAWSVEGSGKVFINSEDQFIAKRSSKIEAKIISVTASKEKIAQEFARAVGKVLGIESAKIDTALEGQLPTEHRFQTKQVGKYYLIDDTYNANPASMEAALNLLRERNGRKVAILGTMKELGENAASYHRQVGEMAHNVADLIIGVGELSDNYQPAKQFSDSQAAAKEIFSYLKEGDSILVKGSRGVRMEKIVEEIEKNGIR